jgi:hypothetical protein
MIWLRAMNSGMVKLIALHPDANHVDSKRCCLCSIDTSAVGPASLWVLEWIFVCEDSMPSGLAWRAYNQDVLQDLCIRHWWEFWISLWGPTSMQEIRCPSRHYSFQKCRIGSNKTHTKRSESVNLDVCDIISTRKFAEIVQKSSYGILWTEWHWQGEILHLDC